MKHNDFYWIFVIVLTLNMLLMMSSCKSVKYVPVEKVRTEIEYRDRVYRDSVHMIDSVYIRERSDTVFVERWHTMYKEVKRTDTLLVYRTDTVQVPYPVEKKLSRWESLKMDIGGIAAGMIVALSLIVVWLVKTRGRR